MKKLLSFVLVFVMAVSMATVAFAAESTSAYEKVTTGELTDGKYVLVAGNGYAPSHLDGSWVLPEQPTVDGDKVTDTKGCEWTLTVNGATVKLTDPNGKSIAPKAPDKNSIVEGECWWTYTYSEGTFAFTAEDGKIVFACNTDSQNGLNRFRGYKSATAANTEVYLSEFTLYKLTEGTVNPVEPPVDPVEPPVDPVEPPVDPVEPPVDPVEPPVDPVEPPVDPVEPAVKVTMQDAPVAGTALKLGMVQTTLGKTLYFAGTTANKEYYLATTEDVNAAADVFVEEVEGGYRLYFMQEGVKTYIDLILKDGKYRNLSLTAEPTTVYNWDSEYKTFYTTVEDTKCYIGTYASFDTMSACKFDFITNDDSCPAHLYLVEENTNPNPTDPEPDPTGDFIAVAFGLMAISGMGLTALAAKKKF